ncbi:MAG: Spy/CpxP family protein refolding chaperone [bacterium]|jgi:Spy/CpxP family protein refolding chaperone|nr:Spy/CpxP family protein refolding chaperone [bacterium]
MRSKIFIWVMISSLVVATGAVAQRPDRPFQPKPPRMAALDLTEEQEAKIQDLELKLEKEMMPLRSQIPAIEANLKQELIADQFNQAKVKSLIDQKVKILSEIEFKQLLNQRAVRDLLTPDQRKQFDLHALKEGMRHHGKLPLPMRPHEPGADVLPPGLEK